MKKPTLEEVKEYFKDAETVHTSGGIVEMNLNNIFCQEQLYWVKFRFGCYIIWSETEVYAKILTYKDTNEETFVITKEQIKSLYSYAGANNQHNLEKWFPKAFEEDKKELVVGKWYVDRTLGLIFYLTKVKNNGLEGYGFGSTGKWHEGDFCCTLNRSLNNTTNLQPATEQEVSEALKKEAVKRGYNNNYKCLSLPEHTHKVENNFHFDLKYNMLFQGISPNSHNNVVFENGIWASILPTISIKEAEERLNCKIV